MSHFVVMTFQETMFRVCGFWSSFLFLFNLFLFNIVLSLYCYCTYWQVIYLYWVIIVARLCKQLFRKTDNFFSTSLLLQLLGKPTLRTITEALLSSLFFCNHKSKIHRTTADINSYTTNKPILNNNTGWILHFVYFSLAVIDRIGFHRQRPLFLVVLVHRRWNTLQIDLIARMNKLSTRIHERHHAASWNAQVTVITYFKGFPLAWKFRAASHTPSKSLWLQHTLLIFISDETATRI